MVAGRRRMGPRHREPAPAHARVAPVADGPLQWKEGGAHSNAAFGVPLAVDLPAAAAALGAKHRVRVFYSTTPDASAIQAGRRAAR